MLVFMGGFGVWTQVWSKGSCVGNQKQRLFLLGITEKYRKQDMSSFVISSQCNNCMAYQCKRELWVVFYLQSNKIAFEYQSVIF